MSISKNGILAKEVKKLLGITYKTTWRRIKQIRLGMTNLVRIISRTIKMNETYIGW